MQRRVPHDPREPSGRDELARRRRVVFAGAARASRQGLLLAALLVPFAVSCASLELVPVDAAPGIGARAAGSGVEVRASADADRLWTVPSAFTPVQISVRNTGAEPVHVGLDDIELAGNARALSAVPPASITPRRRVASLGMDPASPFIAQQSIGSGGARYGRTESIVLEPPVGTHFESSFAGSDPARAEILSSAFRGGSIAAGETREGFVYFRHVPSDAGHMKLRIGVRPTAAHPAPSVVEIVYAIRG